MCVEKAGEVTGCRAVTILRGISNNANIGIVRDASFEFLQKNLPKNILLCISKWMQNKGNMIINDIRGKNGHDLLPIWGQLNSFVFTDTISS